MRAVDWGVGHYEDTAEQLLPAAHVVVGRAAPSRNERVVDVGCGTGNAALLAAARGAHVTGVDPAPRLLEVARQHAAKRGLDVTFAVGEAAALPLANDAVDVVLSVFGVIFAPSPPEAAAEMARVTAGGGRIVLSAWIPGGAVSEAVQAAQIAVREALGAPEPPRPFAWHDGDALAGLLKPHGFEVDVEEHSLAFTGTSPGDYLERSESHPLAVAGRAVLEAAGRAPALRARMLLDLRGGQRGPRRLSRDQPLHRRDGATLSPSQLVDAEDQRTRRLAGHARARS